METLQACSQELFITSTQPASASLGSSMLRNGQGGGKAYHVCFRYGKDNYNSYNRDDKSINLGIQDIVGVEDVASVARC